MPDKQLFKAKQTVFSFKNSIMSLFTTEANKTVKNIKEGESFSSRLLKRVFAENKKIN